MEKGGAAQELGRCRGGFTTKIHVNVNEEGKPLKVVLTGGQVHDVTQAGALMEGQSSDWIAGMMRIG